MKAKLGGMDSEKKLNDLLKSVQDQKNRLNFLESDIDKLIELAKKLDGYTSDDEEAYFVEGLITELQGVKEKVQRAREECDNLERDIIALKKYIDDAKAQKKELADEELNDLMNKIGKIDE